MKYDLGDLKSIADELLDSLRVDRRMAQQLSQSAVMQASVKAARRPAPKRWLMYTAASCVTCAAAAVLIIIASLSQMNPFGAGQLSSGGSATDDNVTAITTPFIITADSGESEENSGAGELMSARLDLSAAPTATYSPGAQYSVVQYENGKWGVKAEDADWLIGPEYDSGYIEGDIAYMQSGELLHVIPLDGE